jgi:hypothetical protein
MKAFYLAWKIPQTPSAESLPGIAKRFPLPWSAYVRLLSLERKEARRFYEEEALRGGWSVRQLERQINSQFYERTALSRNKSAMLQTGQRVNEKLFSPAWVLKVSNSRSLNAGLCEAGDNGAV